jgi:hypothetical protein
MDEESLEKRIRAVARGGQRENLGLGVPGMLRLLAEPGLPEPQIKVEAGEFRPDDLHPTLM